MINQFLGGKPPTHPETNPGCLDLEMPQAIHRPMIRLDLNMGHMSQKWAHVTPHQCSFHRQHTPAVQNFQGFCPETFCKNLPSTIWDQKSLILDPCSIFVYMFGSVIPSRLGQPDLPMLQAPAPAVRFSSDMSLV